MCGFLCAASLSESCPFHVQGYPSASTPTRLSQRDQNTQEFPGKVDRQDDGERQQADHSHEQDDVALERQVGDGIDAAFAADLLVPARITEREKGNISAGLKRKTEDRRAQTLMEPV